MLHSWSRVHGRRLPGYQVVERNLTRIMAKRIWLANLFTPPHPIENPEEHQVDSAHLKLEKITKRIEFGSVPIAQFLRTAPTDSDNAIPQRVHVWLPVATPYHTSRLCARTIPLP